MRITQRKGNAATARAIASFTEMGFDVSIPLTESAAYDLVVDTGRELVRVQCKYSSQRSVGLRRVHSNSGGYVVKKNLPDDYDWLYVLGPERREYVIRSCLAGRNSITLNDAHLLHAIVAT